LSHRLHPSRLELQGIAVASAAMCREISNRHGVEVSFHSENIPHDLSSRIAVCLYRVWQEALQNVIRHSGTASVHVSLRGGADQIELRVDDRGIGFNLEATQRSGLGLTSMQERLNAVAGQFAVVSQPQRGTSIQARVPLFPQ
jgi:signal transduction histidine kinase